MNITLDSKYFKGPIITEGGRETFSNAFAKQLYACGKTLISPADYGLSKTITIIRQIFSERAIMTSPVTSTLKFVTVTVVTTMSLAIAAIGIVMTSLAKVWRHNFTFIQPEVPPELGEELPEDIRQNGLKIASFNIAGLPNCINTINGMPPLEQRISELIRYLSTQTSLHCVLLQELFDEGAIEQISQDANLRRAFPYMIFGAGRQSLGLNSGLAILSRLPIRNPEFHAFNHLRQSDAFAQKGVLGIEVSLSRHHKATLFNTHLQAWDELQSQQSREKSLKAIMQLERIFSRRIRNPSQQHLGTFVIGDFNIAPYLFPSVDELFLKEIKSTLLQRKQSSIDSLVKYFLRNPEWQSKTVQKFFKKRHVTPPADGTEMTVATMQASVGEVPIRGTFVTDPTSRTIDVTEIDHMALRLDPDLAVKRAQVAVDTTVSCSDHFPIIGTFKF
jgi:endonuclease/exonuclease/phosphatase family metal-dependent hydrolase